MTLNIRPAISDLYFDLAGLYGLAIIADLVATISRPIISICARFCTETGRLLEIECANRGANQRKISVPLHRR